MKVIRIYRSNETANNINTAKKNRKKSVIESENIRI